MKFNFNLNSILLTLLIIAKVKAENIPTPTKTLPTKVTSKKNCTLVQTISPQGIICSEREGLYVRGAVSPNCRDTQACFLSSNITSVNKDVIIAKDPSECVKFNDEIYCMVDSYDSDICKGCSFSDMVKALSEKTGKFNMEDISYDSTATSVSIPTNLKTFSIYYDNSIKRITTSYLPNSQTIPTSTSKTISTSTIKITSTSSFKITSTYNTTPVKTLPTKVTSKKNCTLVQTVSHERIICSEREGLYFRGAVSPKCRDTQACFLSSNITSVNKDVIIAKNPSECVKFNDEIYCMVDSYNSDICEGCSFSDIVKVLSEKIGEFNIEDIYYDSTATSVSIPTNLKTFSIYYDDSIKRITTSYLPNSKTIPTSTSKTIPITSKTIPTTSKTIPTSSKTIPTSSKTVPTSSKTVPTSSKTIPTSSKTISCEPVTVHVTVKDTVTVKEIVTVTVKIDSKPTSIDESHCAMKWAQCGGQNYQGPTCCQSGSTCHEVNKYYSQCI